MTRDTVRARQASPPPPGVRAVRVTVTAVNSTTVTVALPGGGSTTAPRAAGFTYTAGGTGWALIQEPAVIAVFPNMTGA